MVAPSLPTQAEPINDGGYARPAWYDFFRLLVQQGFITPEQFEELVARVVALENREQFDFTISGLQSVRVLGTPSGGVVQLLLDGDQLAPGASHYYGTNDDETKGFHALVLDALADVDLTTTPPAAGDALIWDDVDEVWVPGAVAGGSPITTEGDLIVGDAAGLPERLPVGTNGEVLKVVAGVPAWAVASGGVVDFTDLGDVPASYTGAGGQAVVVNVTEDGLVFAPAVSGVNDSTMGATFSLSGLSGVSASIRVNCDGTITSATLLGGVGQSGTAVVDVLKSSYASYDGSLASICASAKPTVTASNKSEDVTLTGWTTAFTAGDCFVFECESNSGFSDITLILGVTKS